MNSDQATTHLKKRGQARTLSELGPWTPNDVEAVRVLIRTIAHYEIAFQTAFGARLKAETEKGDNEDAS